MNSLDNFPELYIRDQATYEQRLYAIAAVALFRNSRMEWDGATRLRFYCTNGMVLGFDREDGETRLLPGSNIHILRMAYSLHQGQAIPTTSRIAKGIDLAYRVAAKTFGAATTIPNVFSEKYEMEALSGML